eukprot:TRINITY_DN14639_c0_g1_i1.p1 TRINITY_DN14639_c0_g1~~TRINITY_DN14639_c0_g1_i1.p1  ORF type:complete len:1421 (-),score=247.02 TRINITY_DN14639_c0_g1_i1:1497-5759(-)
MEDHDSGCEFNADDSSDIVIRRCHDNLKKKVSDSAHRKTMLINNNDELVRIAEELYNKDIEKCKENNLLVDDKDKGGKDLRRNSSGYYSNSSDPGTNGPNGKRDCLTNKTNSTVTKKDSINSKSEFAHVKSKVDTGLGLKKATSIAGSQYRTREPLSSVHQKKSDPIPPTQYNRKYSASFKVPELPSSGFNRNATTRRSLTRLFSRNSDKSNKKNEKDSSNGIKTPFGEVNKPIVNSQADEKRSQFVNKRSITSLSLFNSSKKDDEQTSEVNKERKNSFGRLRGARSSLDLSSIGFGSISRASSKVALTDLKEESDTNTVKSESSKNKSDRPWFDLTRVWKDQTKDLPADDMFHKMRKERSGRAKTVPSRLGSLESSSVTDLSSVPTTFPNCQTPSTLKKTVHLLSPEVLTNWYEKRKKVENLYGPRRNSISNLFFHPDKKQSSPLVELRNGDKLRKSMLNLEELLMGESGSNHGSGKGVQRSESAKLTNERHRWRGKGIQRSESARLINMRQPQLQPRQNSHPNLVHQQSYSSSSSSLADRSSLESPSKLTTYSLSNTDYSLPDNPGNSDSDLEAEADPPDWRHTISEEELKKLSSKELKRQDVINELFHTEKSHVRNLKVLDGVFRRPLLETGRMPKEVVDRLFPNLDEVLAVHQRYNSAMKMRVKQGFPIGDICDILIDMFLGSNGDRLVQVCGEFSKNQNSTIEELKRIRSRDAKLEQFLSDIERNPACRRLQLQSILPCEHQRLVKYPLLLEQIAKHTEKTQDNPEFETVKTATDRTKEILDCIDKQVAEQQNRLRLAEIQSNLDTSGLDKMGSDHPIFLEYRNLDLTNHSLIHDGSLTMKLGDTKRVKSLHVVLLEDCMMLLQKQGEKYLLKFHSSSAGQAPGKEDSRRLFHSPIIKFSTMLVRPVANDKRAFYLLNTTERGPQIYELLSNSATERIKWIKHITEASNAYKCRDGMPKTKSEPEQLGASEKNQKIDLRSQSFREQTNSPRMERAERQNSSPPEGLNIPKKEDEETPESGSTTPSAPKKRLQRVEILKIVDSPPMVDPSQVLVNQATVLVADPVVTPFEKLRQKDEEVSRILEEKQRLISEILHINDDDFDTIADVAANATYNKDARDILLAALSQAKSLTSFVNSNLKITEEDLVARSSPVKEIHSASRSVLGPSGEQLVQITTSMNQHLTDLLAIMQERDEEREVLKRELAKSQEQIRGFFRSDSTRSFPSQFSSSRPNSYISIESDPADFESDPRPNSLLSFSSDTADVPVDSDEDTSAISASNNQTDNGLSGCPELTSILNSNQSSAPDIDLTPTEEVLPSPTLPSPPTHCSSPIQTTSDEDQDLEPQTIKGSDEDDEVDSHEQRRFCVRDTVRNTPHPRVLSPIDPDLRARRNKYSTFDRRKDARTRIDKRYCIQNQTLQ